MSGHTAKGKIISCLRVYQYLTGLVGLQEGIYRLYRFTKININILSEIAKSFKDLFITMVAIIKIRLRLHLQSITCLEHFLKILSDYLQN